MESLLSHLALRREYGLSRGELITNLWPETELSLANRCLHTLIYEIRKLLGREINGAPPVLHDGGYYRLNTEAGVEVDVAQFESLASAGARHAGAGRRGEAAESFRQAVDLYRGQPALGFDGWPAIEIERLRVLYLNLLSQLADHHFSQADYVTCLTVVQRLLGTEPCREDAHRMAMRCHMQLGTRAHAMRQYELCKRILSEEFDVMPEPETTQLFDQIRGGGVRSV
jgi:DNA-binding SARP family transcriptional activator